MFLFFFDNRIYINYHKNKYSIHNPDYTTGDKFMTILNIIWLFSEIYFKTSTEVQNTDIV